MPFTRLRTIATEWRQSSDDGYADDNKSAALLSSQHHSKRRSSSNKQEKVYGNNNKGGGHSSSNLVPSTFILQTTEQRPTAMTNIRLLRFHPPTPSSTRRPTEVLIDVDLTPPPLTSDSNNNNRNNHKSNQDSSDNNNVPSFPTATCCDVAYYKDAGCHNSMMMMMGGGGHSSSLGGSVAMAVGFNSGDIRMSDITNALLSRNEDEAAALLSAQEEHDHDDDDDDYHHHYRSAKRRSGDGGGGGSWSGICYPPAAITSAAVTSLVSSSTHHHSNGGGRNWGDTPPLKKPFPHHHQPHHHSSSSSSSFPSLASLAPTVLRWHPRFVGQCLAGYNAFGGVGLFAAPFCGTEVCSRLLAPHNPLASVVAMEWAPSAGGGYNGNNNNLPYSSSFLSPSHAAVSCMVPNINSKGQQHGGAFHVHLVDFRSAKLHDSLRLGVLPSHHNNHHHSHSHSHNNQQHAAASGRGFSKGGINKFSSRASAHGSVVSEVSGAGGVGGGGAASGGGGHGIHAAASTVPVAASGLSFHPHLPILATYGNIHLGGGEDGEGGSAFAPVVQLWDLRNTVTPIAHYSGLSGNHCPPSASSSSAASYPCYADPCNGPYHHTSATTPRSATTATARSVQSSSFPSHYHHSHNTTQQPSISCVLKAADLSGGIWDLVWGSTEDDDGDDDRESCEGDEDDDGDDDRESCEGDESEGDSDISSSNDDDADSSPFDSDTDDDEACSFSDKKKASQEREHAKFLRKASSVVPIVLFGAKPFFGDDTVAAGDVCQAINNSFPSPPPSMAMSPPTAVAAASSVVAGTSTVGVLDTREIAIAVGSTPDEVAIGAALMMGGGGGGGGGTSSDIEAGGGGGGGGSFVGSFNGGGASRGKGGAGLSVGANTHATLADMRRVGSWRGVGGGGSSLAAALGSSNKLNTNGGGGNSSNAHGLPLSLALQTIGEPISSIVPIVKVGKRGGGGGAHAAKAGEGDDDPNREKQRLLVCSMQHDRGLSIVDVKSMTSLHHAVGLEEAPSSSPPAPPPLSPASFLSRAREGFGINLFTNGQVLSDEVMGLAEHWARRQHQQQKNNSSNAIMMNRGDKKCRQMRRFCDDNPLLLSFPTADGSLFTTVSWLVLYAFQHCLRRRRHFGDHHHHHGGPHGIDAEKDKRIKGLLSYWSGAALATESIEDNVDDDEGKNKDNDDDATADAAYYSAFETRVLTMPPMSSPLYERQEKQEEKKGPNNNNNKHVKPHHEGNKAIAAAAARLHQHEKVLREALQWDEVIFHHKQRGGPHHQSNHDPQTNHDHHDDENNSLLAPHAPLLIEDRHTLIAWLSPLANVCRKAFILFVAGSSVSASSSPLVSSSLRSNAADTLRTIAKALLIINNDKHDAEAAKNQASNAGGGGGGGDCGLNDDTINTDKVGSSGGSSKGFGAHAEEERAAILERALSNVSDRIQAIVDCGLKSGGDTAEAEKLLKTRAELLSLASSSSSSSSSSSPLSMIVYLLLLVDMLLCQTVEGNAEAARRVIRDARTVVWGATPTPHWSPQTKTTTRSHAAGNDTANTPNSVDSIEAAGSNSSHSNTIFEAYRYYTLTAASTADVALLPYDLLLANMMMAVQTRHTADDTTDHHHHNNANHSEPLHCCAGNNNNCLSAASGCLLTNTTLPARLLVEGVNEGTIRQLLNGHGGGEGAFEDCSSYSAHEDECTAIVNVSHNSNGGAMIGVETATYIRIGALPISTADMNGEKPNNNSSGGDSMKASATASVQHNTATPHLLQQQPPHHNVHPHHQQPHHIARAVVPSTATDLQHLVVLFSSMGAQHELRQADETRAMEAKTAKKTLKALSKSAAAAAAGEQQKKEKKEKSEKKDKEDKKEKGDKKKKRGADDEDGERHPPPPDDEEEPSSLLATRKGVVKEEHQRRNTKDKEGDTDKEDDKEEDAQSMSEKAHQRLRAARQEQAEAMAAVLAQLEEAATASYSSQWRLWHEQYQALFNNGNAKNTDETTAAEPFLLRAEYNLALRQWYDFGLVQDRNGTLFAGPSAVDVEFTHMCEDPLRENFAPSTSHHHHGNNNGASSALASASPAGGGGSGGVVNIGDGGVPSLVSTPASASSHHLLLSCSYAAGGGGGAANSSLLALATNPDARIPKSILQTVFDPLPPPLPATPSSSHAESGEDDRQQQYFSTLRTSAPVAALHTAINSGNNLLTTASSSSLAEASTAPLRKHSCASPMPLCGVCGVHMDRSLSAKLRSSPSEWFMWCTCCGHGGHARHVEAWFARNELCPFPLCPCSCRRIAPTVEEESSLLDLQDAQLRGLMGLSPTPKTASRGKKKEKEAKSEATNQPSAPAPHQRLSRKTIVDAIFQIYPRAPPADFASAGGFSSSPQQQNDDSAKYRAQIALLASQQQQHGGGGVSLSTTLSGNSNHIDAITTGKGGGVGVTTAPRQHHLAPQTLQLNKLASARTATASPSSTPLPTAPSASADTIPYFFTEFPVINLRSD